MARKTIRQRALRQGETVFYVETNMYKGPDAEPTIGTVFCASQKVPLPSLESGIDYSDNCPVTEARLIFDPDCNSSIPGFPTRRQAMTAIKKYKIWRAVQAAESLAISRSVKQAMTLSVSADVPATLDR